MKDDDKFAYMSKEEMANRIMDMIDKLKRSVNAARRKADKDCNEKNSLDFLEKAKNLYALTYAIKLLDDLSLKVISLQDELDLYDILKETKVSKKELN